MADTISISPKPKNKPSVRSVLECLKHDEYISLSSYSENNTTDLRELFLGIPDKLFYELLRKRLRLPVLKESVNADIDEEREYLLESYTTDQLFKEISKAGEVVTSNGKEIRVREYYNRALKIFKFIDIAKSDLEFVINISDLSPRLIAELKTLDKISADYVLKLAVGGIFENINSKRYHSLGFAKRLKVRLDR